jgi:hypothetical protein
MATDSTPHSPAATVDVSEVLSDLIGVTGSVHEVMGGWKINVHHCRAFPWDEVFKVLLFRDFRVSVGRKKADIFIEAQP